MNRIEITYRSQINELTKLNEKLEREEKAYQKKLEKAQKLGIAEWTNKELNEWAKTCPTIDGIWFANKKDAEKNGAWYDLQIARDHIEETKERIEKREKKLAQTQVLIDDYYEKVEEFNDIQRKLEMWKLEFEEEQREWAKDGIILEGRYYGKTPSGKNFEIYRNTYGYTERFMHCYTLKIGGECIFTSGAFWLAYITIRDDK